MLHLQTRAQLENTAQHRHTSEDTFEKRHTKARQYLARTLKLISQTYIVLNVKREKKKK